MRVESGLWLAVSLASNKMKCEFLPQRIKMVSDEAVTDASDTHKEIIISAQ